MKTVKNYLYNLVNQITVLAFPFITLPYITRVLGVENIGVYSYTNSIVNYFYFFATLGISLYASREVAYSNNDLNNRSKVFWDIFILQIILASITLIAYIIFLFFFNSKSEFTVYFTIQIITLICAGIDITWFYIGIENFKIIVIRSVIIRLITFILLFAVVKHSNDLWKYILLVVSGTLLGQTLLWINISKHIHYFKISIENIVDHFIKSLKIAYINFIGVLCTNLNKTILGIFVSTIWLGKYDTAYKLITMTIVMATSLLGVLAPKNSSLFANNDKKGLFSSIQISFSFISILSFIGMLVLLGLALTKDFILFFLGNQFLGIETLLLVLAPMVVINSWSTIIATQYMIPTKNERKFIVSLTIGTIIGVPLSFILVYFYNTSGACYAVIVQELVILLCHLFQIKKEFPVKTIFSDMWKLVVAFLIGLAIFLIIHRLRLNIIIKTFLQIMLSSSLFFISIYFLNAKYLLLLINEGKKSYKKL